jgi:cell division protein FtsB
MLSNENGSPKRIYVILSSVISFVAGSVFYHVYFLYPERNMLQKENAATVQQMNKLREKNAALEAEIKKIKK